MIPPFNQSGARLLMGYNGLALNDPADTASTGTYEINVVAVDPAWDAMVEPRVQTHGVDGFQPRKVQTIIQMDGVVRAPTFAKLLDKVRTLNNTLDMVDAYDADSATYNKGYLPLTFSIPTTDTGTYATGYITCKYLARCLRAPVVRSSQYEGTTARFSLIFQAADPRCYFTTAQTGSRSNAGTITIDNSLSTFPSWPTITITLTGAGSQVITLTQGSRVLRLDLTGIASGHVIVVDMEHHVITDNGTEDMGIYVSGNFFDMPASASANIAVANISGTLAATVGASWYRVVA
jgi:hypothetical protein